MKALILGATGAVGKDLTALLLNAEAFERVDIFVRRDPGLTNPKLVTHIVDFNQPDQWSDEIQGDVVFSCMGTNRKAAGSKENQYKVDYTYQYNFAKAAAKNGVSAYILVSSVGADAKSSFFYMRMKGELDDAIQQLGFKQTVIVRPPSLIRKNTTKAVEKITIPIIQFFNKLGLFKAQAPMETITVAKAMVKLAKVSSKGLHIISGQLIRQYAE